MAIQEKSCIKKKKKMVVIALVFTSSHSEQRS